jgi:hypothetical protein
MTAYLCEGPGVNRPDFELKILATLILQWASITLFHYKTPFYVSQLAITPTHNLIEL